MALIISRRSFYCPNFATAPPGAVDGLNTFFTPNWEQLADPTVWIAAYGHIFFSFSIAFGIMLSYSSYLKRRSDLTGSGVVVAFANTSFELLAGIGVFAALGFLAYSQSIPVADLEGITGVGLAFITFPTLLSQMPGEPLIGSPNCQIENEHDCAGECQNQGKMGPVSLRSYSARCHHC